METKEYVERDRRFVEVNGGNLTGDSYFVLAFAVSVATGLTGVCFGLVGFLVESLSSSANPFPDQFGLEMLIGVALVFVTLLMSYPIYRYVVTRIIKQRFKFRASM